ncbi:hypothetical protein [Paenibacillus cellulositrophicus]|uniref:hypothetical protein n=1 Tax=Paenibacillus cellulositrophicus TaxID=562959 RepID=UPI0012672395|nr:hypothetical protein [Paenibacillus cellulositrophicus]
MKKISSVFVGLIASLTIAVSANAEEVKTVNTNEVDNQTITSNQGNESITWNYTVYDKDGNVINQGEVPNDSGKIQPRYTWSGVTLKNGEHALFVPSTDSRGLWALKGTSMTVSYTLDRSAQHQFEFAGWSSGQLDLNQFGGIGFSRKYTAPVGDYYRASIYSNSSDPFTIKSFSIVF